MREVVSFVDIERPCCAARTRSRDLVRSSSLRIIKLAMLSMLSLLIKAWLKPCPFKTIYEMADSKKAGERIPGFRYSEVVIELAAKLAARKLQRSRQSPAQHQPGGGFGNALTSGS